MKTRAAGRPKLRVAVRTDGAAGSIDGRRLGMPMVRGLTV